jgi:hypothetical protein
MHLPRMQSKWMTKTFVLNSGASNPSEYTPTVCGLNKKELLKDILHLFGK